jgi:hypothetical protein
VVNHGHSRTRRTGTHLRQPWSDALCLRSSKLEVAKYPARTASAYQELGILKHLAQIGKKLSDYVVG